MRHILLLAFFSTGCAFSGRTMGMHDPIIDSVQAMATANAQIVASVTAALEKVAASACHVPERVQ